MRRIWQFVRDSWCYLMHPDPMWPVNGQYRCPSCQRLYPVPWEANVTRWNYRPQHSMQEAFAAQEVPPEAGVGAVRALKRLVSAQ